MQLCTKGVTVHIFEFYQKKQGDIFLCQIALKHIFLFLFKFSLFFFKTKDVSLSERLSVSWGVCPPTPGLALIFCNFPRKNRNWVQKNIPVFD